MWFKNIIYHSKSLIHESIKNKMQYLYGINPIFIALQTKKRQINKIIISNSQAIHLNSRITNIFNAAKQLQIPIYFGAKDKLDSLVRGQPHQNVIMFCSVLKYIPIDHASNITDGITIWIDKITDPQNFGAILRSCLYFGISNIIVGKNSSCPLNSTVSKTSSGALELMQIKSCSNELKFIQQWKQSSGIILSTECKNYKDNIPIDRVLEIQQIRNHQRILLIIGSEGTGVSEHLSKHSDYSIQIQRKGPNNHPYNLIDSLNVSAALTSILFQLTRTKK